MPLLLDPLLLITPCNRDPAIRRRMPAAAATPCEWAEGTMFLDACKMDEIGIDYAAAARELAVCIALQCCPCRRRCSRVQENAPGKAGRSPSCRPSCEERP